MIYASPGDASVLQVVERAGTEPAEGEIRIRVAASGVNPTDRKSRSGAFGGATSRADGPQPRRRERIADAAAALNRAIEDGAFRIDEQAGLPVHRLGLDDTAAAHDTVEGAAVGKDLIKMSD